MTLQGFAYQGNLKSAATRAVKRVSGVDDVANSIAVLPASQNDDRIRWATFYRIYLHTGECDIRHDMVAGIAVGTAAQVAMHAASGEVLVSRTVKDLVAGSGVRSRTVESTRCAASPAIGDSTRSNARPTHPCVRKNAKPAKAAKQFLSEEFLAEARSRNSFVLFLFDPTNVRKVWRWRDFSCETAHIRVFTGEYDAARLPFVEGSRRGPGMFYGNLLQAWAGGEFFPPAYPRLVQPPWRSRTATTSCRR